MSDRILQVGVREGVDESISDKAEPERSVNKFDAAYSKKESG